MSTKKNKHLKVPKILILIGKILQFFSIKWTTLYLSRLFTTPIKHKIPKRELLMDQNSIQTTIIVPEINKEIVLYQLGTSEKKVLLVHGWSGRGTQLVKFADALIDKGYSIVSFDAPSHGKSSGNSSIMTDFIASIAELDRRLGPFDAAVGHSLGGMSLLNAVKQGLNINKLVTIGSGDKVKDILIDFVAKFKLKSEFSEHLREHFEKKYHTEMESYSAYLAAKSITIPVLVIHDENDTEVPVAASKNIYSNLKFGKILITNNLGHRKILGSQEVIDKTINFIIN